MNFCLKYISEDISKTKYERTKQPQQTNKQTDFGRAGNFPYVKFGTPALLPCMNSRTEYFYMTVS